MLLNSLKTKEQNTKGKVLKLFQILINNIRSTV